MKALALLLVCALCPLAPLWMVVDAGPVSDDFYFTSRAFSLSPVTLVTSTEWQHQLMPEVSGYRPLALVSYEASRRLGGGRIEAYRAANYGLHVLVTLLVGWLCLRWSGSLRAALMASIAFGLHPLHHENVVWISGRTHTLAALFTLAGLCVLLSARHRGTWRAALAMAIATAAALASYEGAVIVPAIAFALAMATSSASGWQRWKTSALTAAPAAAVTTVYLVTRMLWLSALSNETAVLSTGRAIRNVAGLAARLLAVPRLEHTPLVWSWPFLVSAAIAIPAIASVIQDARTRTLGCTAIALVFVSYLPYVFLPGYSDRFAYLASVWFVIGIAVGLDSLWRREHRVARPAAVLAAGLLFVTWGVRLREAGLQWRTAGSIAREIRVQAKELLPAPAAGASLRFLCVPDFHGTALVYLTYFERAIQDAYGRADIQPRRVAIGPGGIDGGASGALFWWDGTARRLHLIEPGAAVGCRAPAVVKP